MSLQQLASISIAGLKTDLNMMKVDYPTTRLKGLTWVGVIALIGIL